MGVDTGTREIKIGKETYLIEETKRRPGDSNHISQVFKVAKKESPSLDYYYVTVWTQRERLAKADLLPFSCSCPDYQMRRLFSPGLEGTCKHIKALLEEEIIQ